MRYSEFKSKLDETIAVEQATRFETGLSLVQAIGKWTAGYVELTHPTSAKRVVISPYVAVLSTAQVEAVDRRYVVALGDDGYYGTWSALHSLRSSEPPANPIEVRRREALKELPAYVSLQPVHDSGMSRIVFVDGHPDSLFVQGSPTIAGSLCEMFEAIEVAEGRYR